MNKDLTKRQKAVLDYIEAYIREKAYGPTVREICDGLGLSSPSTVHAHLKALEEKGLISRDALKSRSITLNYDIGGVSNNGTIIGSVENNLISVPLVGNVAAGEPIFAEENIEETVMLPVSIVGDDASFMLSVRGESMIDAGINDGDTVVVKSQSTARNGEIIVALLEDGATVKRFYREKDHIRLQPENPTMDPILVYENLQIIGKVVALFRTIH